MLQLWYWIWSYQEKYLLSSSSSFFYFFWGIAHDPISCNVIPFDSWIPLIQLLLKMFINLASCWKCHSSKFSLRISLSGFRKKQTLRLLVGKPNSVKHFSNLENALNNFKWKSNKSISNILGFILHLSIIQSGANKTLALLKPGQGPETIASVQQKETISSGHP